MLRIIVGETFYLTKTCIYNFKRVSKLQLPSRSVLQTQRSSPDEPEDQYRPQFVNPENHVHPVGCLYYSESCHFHQLK